MDQFTQAYIEAALWSTNDESDESGGNPLDDNYGPEDIAPDTLAEMVADCKRFQEENADDIDGRDGQAGYDFWMTRNGHGVGFWETPDWPEDSGSRLTEASEVFGEVYLYVGDNGRIDS